ILLLAGIAAYRANETLAAATASLVQTKDVELALERTLSLLRDAETGQRGYLLTRRPDYLGPYEQSVALITTQLGALRELLRYDDTARRSLDELTTLVQVKTEELARTVDLERGGATADALGVVLTDAGRFAMDEIRSIVERMQTDEDRKLDSQLTAEN